MSLLQDDVERLKAAGFIDMEIEYFANAQTNQYDSSSQGPIDLNSELWHDVIQSRVDWIKYHRDVLMENSMEIDDQIRMYYLRNKERNPYDFVKAEYKGRKKVDYITASKNRATKRLKRGGMKLGKQDKS